MAKYLLPAKEGKLIVDLPKSARIKSWNSFGDKVLVELDKEFESMKEFKV